MLTTYNQIRVCIVVVLCIILLGQGLWAYKVYRSYQTQWRVIVEKAIEKAILREGQARHELLGGTIFSQLNNDQVDTARYFTKTVRTIDTTFHITFDRHDPFSESKFIQFMNKDELPLDVQRLDSLFRLELVGYHFPLGNTEISYIDLKKNTVLASTSVSSIPFIGWITTEIIPIDIFDTIGIQAHAQIKVFSALGSMGFQLLLSTVFIIICIILLYTVGRTFFWRERVEIMRQNSVNAMTHEFKRPISAAVAQVALIPYYLQKGQFEKVQQYAETVQLELDKLTSYTERVQRLSNNSQDDIVVQRELIPLSDFLYGIVEKHKESEEKTVAISLQIDTLETYIYVDRVHFSNILENLIENAIKYSQETVSIVVEVSDENGQLVIAVKDNGLGISEIDKAQIFNRFYRSEHKEVQKRVGFGLGLTYVRAMVEAHHGTITVASRLGVGSEFKLFIPIKDYAQ